MGEDGYTPRQAVQLPCGVAFTCSVGAPVHQKNAARQATDRNAILASAAIERSNAEDKLRENTIKVVNRLKSTGQLDELQRLGTDRLVESAIAKAADASSGDLNGAARQAGAAIGAAAAKRVKIDLEAAAREAGAGAGFSFTNEAVPETSTPAAAARPAAAVLSPAVLPIIASFTDAQAGGSASGTGTATHDGTAGAKTDKGKKKARNKGK